MKKIFALIIVLMMSVNCAGVVFAVESEAISAFLYELNAVTKTDEFINVINENIWSVSDLKQYAYYADNSKIQYATSQLFLQNGTSFISIVDFQTQFEINVLLTRANNVSFYSEMSEIIYQFAPYIDIGEYNSLTSSEQAEVWKMMSSYSSFYSAEQFRTRLLSCIDEIAHSSSTVYPGGGGDSSTPSFGGGGSPIDAQIDTCTFSDSIINATITFNNNTSDSIMYVAVYHKDNYLKHLKKYSLPSGTMSLDIQISDYIRSDGDVLKLFFLDTTDGITPLGFSLNCEINSIVE